ncbi:nucleotidyltransferase family protein [Streptomyces sp. NPDC002054]|uniref:nucleotidyltransferase family protein n=1 Tax=Streptomyces sp. NPDC002054 TaxID=3154663 RepID=UPI00331E2609
MTDNEIYWHAVTVLGRLGDRPHGDPHPSDVLTEVDRGHLDPDRLHTHLVHSKVVRLARHRLHGTSGGPGVLRLRELITDTDDHERRRHATAAEPVRDVVRLVAAGGLRLMKGMAQQPLYPWPESRHVGDVDVHAPDLTGALDLASALRRRGWCWDFKEFPWIKKDEAGLVYGQLGLLLRDGTRPVSRVDIHFGAYSVGYAGRMPLVGWQDRTVLGTRVRVPATETALALIAAHALGDTRLSMKDVNDIHLLLDDTTVDWTSVLETVRIAGALHALEHLLAATDVVYGLPAGAPRLTSGRRPLRPTGLPSGVRGAHFGAHARTDETARGTVDPEEVARRAAHYFEADLRPRLAHRPPAAPAPMAGGRDRCWRLLPDSAWPDAAPDEPVPDGEITRETIAPGLVLERLGDAAVVRLDMSAGAEAEAARPEVFLPTLDGDVTPASVALARRLAGRGA